MVIKWLSFALIWLLYTTFITQQKYILSRKKYLSITWKINLYIYIYMDI